MMDPAGIVLSKRFIMINQEGRNNNNNNNKRRRSSGSSSSRICSIRELVQAASVALGVQFGWALQLSLLTPYIQELGISHAGVSLIWLCGPVSGTLVQPLVGHYSDRCTSKYGRRRPFLVAGAVFVVIAGLIISFSADLGYLMGDNVGDGDDGAFFRPRAIAIFVLGFWVFDLANNTIQGPCRALLADLVGDDEKRSRSAFGFSSTFMALGNVLGFAASAYDRWYQVFPFTKTHACDKVCANLKSVFFVEIFLLLFTVVLTLKAAPEIPWNSSSKSWRNPNIPPTSTTPLLSENHLEESNEAAATEIDEDEKEADGDQETEDQELVAGHVLWDLVGALQQLQGAMWCILAVTALTWISWYPFLLYDTDWMGREVYGGDPSDPAHSKQYYDGVSMGALGLMLNSIILGLFSLIINYLCRHLGSNCVWGVANLIMGTCFVGTLIITWAVPPAAFIKDQGPPAYIKAAALGLFALLGIPLAVTYSLPYALTATFTEAIGGGQGLAMGVLNLAVVVPQIFLSIGSGYWDELWGGGNSPAFLLGAVVAVCSAIAAVLLLPRQRRAC